MGADSHTGPQALRAGDVVRRCAWATHLQVQVLMVSPGSVSPGDLRPRSPPGLAAGPGSPPGRRTCWPAAKLTVPGQAAQGAEDADGAGWPGTQGPGGAGSATEHLSRPVFLGAGTMVFHLCPGSQRGVSTQWTDGWTEGQGPVSLARPGLPPALWATRMAPQCPVGQACMASPPPAPPGAPLSVAGTVPWWPHQTPEQARARATGWASRWQALARGRRRRGRSPLTDRALGFPQLHARCSRPVVLHLP